MKRTALLHAELSHAIASMGHGDMLVIGDVGLPIPNGPRRIDLALTPGIPAVADVLRVVLTELQVETLVAGIECPALAIFADPAQPYLPDEVRRRRVGQLPRGRLQVLPGGHHLHMQQPEPSATAVADFLRA